MVPKEFADYLNELLQTEDRSASWLARRLQVSPSTVSRWCDGSTRPDTQRRVEHILDIFGVHDADTRRAVLAAYYWWQRNAA